MSDATLQIKIGADVKQAVTGISDIKLSLRDAENLLKELKNYRLDIVDDAALARSNQAIRDVGDTIKQATTLGVDGFDKLGNKIKSTSGPIGETYSGLRKLANVLPGIGIGSLIALGFEGLSAAISSFAGASSAAEREQEALNKALGDGSAKVQGEIAELTDLAAIALDTSNSTKLRGDAFGKLQSLYPGYLSNLSIEKSSYADIEAALNKVSSALVRQSQIKGLEGAIEETYKNLSKTVAEGGTTFEKVTGNISGFVAGLTDSVGGVKGFIAAFDKAKAGSLSHSIGVDSKEAADQVELLNNKLKEVFKSSFSSGDDLLKVKPEKAKAAADALSLEVSALGQLLQLQNQAGKTSNDPLFKQLADSVNENDALLLSDKIALTIRDNARDGIKKSITDQEVKLMQDQLDKLLNPDLSSGINSTIIKSKLENVGKEVSDQFKKIDAKAFIHLTIAGFDQDAVKANAKIIAKMKDQLAKGIGSTIGDVASAELANVGTIIGDAINGSGDQLDGAIKNIAGILGSGLKQIGQLYIETGVAMALAQKTFKALATTNPVAAIAVGVGLEILGTVLENSVQKKSAHAFADGGIVTQATLGLVGEAGPEAIFPLSQLGRFIKNTQGASGAVNVTGKFKLAGNDLVIGLKRGQKMQNMV